MILMQPATRRPARRGIILMIVVIMLALFSVIGVAFVLYSESEANASRIYREAYQQTAIGSPPVPTDVFNSALAQIIYDVPDDQTGAFSGVRGWSLARSEFGGFYTGAPNAAAYTNPLNPSGDPANNIAYNGAGRMHGTTFNGAAMNPFNVDDYSLVNYTFFPGDKFIRDPERPGTRNMTNPANVNTSPPGQYVGMNAPYTYPDENNLFLAAVRPSDGKVLVPSFYRPWLFDPNGTFGLSPANPNWTSAQGKYLINRPRPQENPLFPAVPANPDGSYTGDIQQMTGTSYQHNDSLWMDFDLPVRFWKGKYYKPLVATLVIDLDGRLNVNMAGNFKGGNGQSSAQGFGPWEMNLSTVIDSQNNSTGGTGLVTLDNGANGVTGRYGSGAVPNRPYFTWSNGAYQTADVSSPGQTPPFYSQGDWDGSALTNGAGSLSLPPLYKAANGYFTPFQVGANYQNGSMAERTNHPSLYNPYLLSNLATAFPGRDRTFGPVEMYYLNNKFNGGDSTYQLAELGKLLPANFGQSVGSGTGWVGTSNPRFMATTISNDLDRVGLAPWQTDSLSGQPTDYQWAPPGSSTQTFSGTSNQPFGQPISFPTTSPVPTGWTDFNANTWRSVAAAIGGVDLNRNLADYKDPTTPWNDMNQTVPNVTFAGYTRAVHERQIFAAEIFERLCLACGTKLLTTINGQPATVATYGNYPNQYNALRWLAQIAVNIVDYIDNDDYMTPFPWNASIGGTEILFGTELPRLVINEAMVRVDTSATYGGATVQKIIPPAVQATTVASQYGVNVWVELHNPLTPQTNSTAGLTYAGAAPLWVNNANTGNQPSSVYKILMTQANTTLRNLTNLTGTPDGTQLGNPVTFTTVPAANQFVQTSNGGLGGYVAGAIGSSTNRSIVMFGPAALPGTDNVNPTTTLTNLQYTITLDQTTGLPTPATSIDATTGLPVPPTLLLQRLACPELPLQANPAQPFYNPFITVDYFTFTSKDANGNNTVNDGRQYLPMPTGGSNTNRKPINQQASYGRRQPYAGYAGALTLGDANSQVVRMNLINPAATPEAMNMPDQGTMNHTFFRHNYQSANNGPAAASNTTTPDTLDPRFDLLLHMDRKLVSPIELINVSAYRPHELTQQFIIGPRYNQANWQQNVNQHMASWMNDATRLWRAMALLETRSRILGVGMGGRVPGKVNINTIWDQNIFQAMLDANGANHFSAVDVGTMWANLMQGRDGVAPVGNGASGPSGTQQPFLGIATAISPGGYGTPYSAVGSGLATSPFRLLVPGQKMFDAPLTGNLDPSQPNFAGHPYFKHEPLNKIFSNLTTRSNTFAVWMTIGYFEVTNGPGPFGPTNRPILGQELGSNDGTVQRNKFFTVIDRTKLAVDMTVAARNVQGPPPVFFEYEPVQTANVSSDPDTTATAVVQVTIPATSNTNGSLQGTYDGTSWTITPNSTTLLISPDDVPFWSGSVSATPRRIFATVSSIVSFTPGTGNNNGTAVIQLQLNQPAAPASPIAIYRGASMMIFNTTPGNPGPQPNFNYRSPVYTPVVPYVIQVQ